MKNKFGIHWFRRDLRIAGNENLRHNWKVSERNVLGLFCFDEAFLSREDFSHNRFAFFLKTLKELKKELQMQGGDLLVVNAQPKEAFTKLFDYLKKENYSLPEIITYGRDYEPFARQRDKHMQSLFGSYNIKTHSERDHVLIEPHEVLKDDATFYQVYSPFAKKWFDKLNTTRVQARLFEQKNISGYYKRLQENNLEKIFGLNWAHFKNLPFDDSFQKFEDQNNKNVSIEIPEAGFKNAYASLLQFKNQVNVYKENRDIPSLNGTSNLSLYQKNGSLVSSQIISTLELGKYNFKMPQGPLENAGQYIKEIAWREFYYSVMYHRPDCEKQSFLPQYINLKWQNDQELFEAWCNGKTGYPIVDAGMRQLNTTGWMHNRVRMIVASFLVKDLLIDWRWGENYFMKMLLDGDLAPNNGGWQWAASTGCDPQPYFRIFNPWLQSAKFDPEAVYIKKYIPELNELSAKDIHNVEGLAKAKKYPKPIVNHALQKAKAILLFKEAQTAFKKSV